MTFFETVMAVAVGVVVGVFLLAAIWFCCVLVSVIVDHIRYR